MPDEVVALVVGGLGVVVASFVLELAHSLLWRGSDA